MEIVIQTKIGEVKKIKIKDGGIWMLRETPNKSFRDFILFKDIKSVLISEEEEEGNEEVVPLTPKEQVFHL